MDLYCRRCNHKLTTIPLTEASQFTKEGDTETLSSYHIATAEALQFVIGDPPVTHFVGNYSLLLNDHPDSNRLIGCCGPGQMKKYNQVCSNCSQPVGIILEDCIGPHCTGINLDRLSTTPAW